jgi:hypothetical protein
LLGFGINVSRPFAEILIIVVGVLIALGVDSWNDNRVDRILETQYLERLNEDLRWNVERTRELVEAHSRKLSVLEDLAETTSQSRLIESDPISVIAALGSGVDLGWVSPSFRVGTFEELRSTGNLGLIRNVELRAALGDYDIELTEILSRINARRTSFPQFVYTLLPSGPLYESLDLNTTATPNLDVAVELDEELVEALQSAEFRRLLNAERNFSTFAKAAIELLEDQIEQVLESVQQEIAD